MSGGGAAGTRAELHYHGEAPTGEGLPAIVVLDPEESVLEVGREDGCGMLLDSPAQKNSMISRRHATLHYDKHSGQWKITDRDSTNGILHNGVKVTEQSLSDNDVITFGGARSTIEGASPGKKAPKSKYVYKFVLHDASASSSQQAPGREHKRGRSLSEDIHEGREGKRHLHSAPEDDKRASPARQKMNCDMDPADRPEPEPQQAQRREAMDEQFRNPHVDDKNPHEAREGRGGGGRDVREGRGSEEKEREDYSGVQRGKLEKAVDFRIHESSKQEGGEAAGESKDGNLGRCEHVVGAGSGVGGQGGEQGKEGTSERHRKRPQAEAGQEASAKMMEKALKRYADVRVQDEAKQVFKTKARDFLGCLLHRPELTGSLKPQNIQQAINGWIDGTPTGPMSQLIRNPPIVDKELMAPRSWSIAEIKRLHPSLNRLDNSGADMVISLLGCFCRAVVEEICSLALNKQQKMVKKEWLEIDGLPSVDDPILRVLLKLEPLPDTSGCTSAGPGMSASTAESTVAAAEQAARVEAEDGAVDAMEPSGAIGGCGDVTESDSDEGNDVDAGNNGESGKREQADGVFSDDNHVQQHALPGAAAASTCDATPFSCVPPVAPDAGAAAATPTAASASVRGPGHVSNVGAIFSSAPSDADGAQQEEVRGGGCRGGGGSSKGGGYSRGGGSLDTASRNFGGGDWGGESGRGGGKRARGSGSEDMTLLHAKPGDFFRFKDRLAEMQSDRRIQECWTREVENVAEKQWATLRWMEVPHGQIYADPIAFARGAGNRSKDRPQKKEIYLIRAHITKYGYDPNDWPHVEKDNGERTGKIIGETQYYRTTQRLPRAATTEDNMGESTRDMRAVASASTCAVVTGGEMNQVANGSDGSDLASGGKGSIDDDAVNTEHHEKPGTAAKAPHLPGDWIFETKNGWKPFHPDEARAVEEAFQAGRPTISVKDRQYDLRQMFQINTKSQRKRKIERLDTAVRQPGLSGASSSREEGHSAQRFFEGQHSKREHEEIDVCDLTRDSDEGEDMSISESSAKRLKRPDCSPGPAVHAKPTLTHLDVHRGYELRVLSDESRVKHAFKRSDIAWQDSKKPYLGKPGFVIMDDEGLERNKQGVFLRHDEAGSTRAIWWAWGAVELLRADATKYITDDDLEEAALRKKFEDAAEEVECAHEGAKEIHPVNDDEASDHYSELDESSSGSEEEEQEILLSLPLSNKKFDGLRQNLKECIARAAGVRELAVTIESKAHDDGDRIRVHVTVISPSPTRLSIDKINAQLQRAGLPHALLDDDDSDILAQMTDSGVVGSAPDALLPGPQAPPACVLPASVTVTSQEFVDFTLPTSVPWKDYQQELRQFFTGKSADLPSHDWTSELRSMKEFRSGNSPPPSLSIWQAAGYKHAQRILQDRVLRGCLFWWSCGSGKSIMVALLIDCLLHEFRRQPSMKIVVVTTPQNVKENGLKECVKSLLRFSPRHAATCAGTDVSEDDISRLQKMFQRPTSAKIFKKDFWSFRQFYSQYKDKSDQEMKNVCLIIDECHELFNEKLKYRQEIYTIVSKAHKIFTLSGTPWRNSEQIMEQLRLLRTSSSNEELDAECATLSDEERIRRFSEGCVSYVDGTKDISTHPIDAGWSVEKCKMSEKQLCNFSTRCHLQLSTISGKLNRTIQNSCQLAQMLSHKDKSTRDLAYAACRNTQIAAGDHWGSHSSGLCQVLDADPRPEMVEDLAPKFARLIQVLQRPHHSHFLNNKHFVYSAYQGTITHLGITLAKVQVQGNHIFRELKADDFEWDRAGKRLELKQSVDIEPAAICFAMLKGNADDKKKLKAAFGFVTPGGDRFEGLRRAHRQFPLLQVLLGARETNQGLTFLRLQYIHILEPNPRGWGQIIQTIGRGIRRGTHKNVTEDELRKVRTKIYVTTMLDDSWLKEETQRQIKQVCSRLAEEHQTYDSEYEKLKADALPKCETKKLQHNLKVLSKNVRKLLEEKAQLEEHWLRVPTGKKTSNGEDKKKMVRAWKLLPDDAIFHVTHQEEKGRLRFDKVIKESSVDFLLLREFHSERRQSFASKQFAESYEGGVKERFTDAASQEFKLGEVASLHHVGRRFDLSPTTKCSICRDDSPSCKGVNYKFGVECCEGHFVCAPCYQILAALANKKRFGSAKDAKDYYTRKSCGGSVSQLQCTRSDCFAHFLLETEIRFPRYWKTRDCQHHDIYENTFMKDRLQDLIRKSVRPQCQPHTGCTGSDGESRGTTTARVEKVLRIENGPLWKTYWERKQKMIADCKKRKPKPIPAKTMDGFCNIFPSVEVNQDINEMFLFHGTNKKAAESIAKYGFDLQKASLSGLYGGGTYCADFSCKSVHYTNKTEDLRALIICRVLMGKAEWTKKELSGSKEAPDGKQSVFAQEGVSRDGKQKHNEYVTYASDQVYPEYIVFIRLK